jgi:integrase
MCSEHDRYSLSVAIGETEMESQRRQGHIFRIKKSWYGRWRRHELETLPDGSKKLVKRQHCEKLCEYGDRFRAPKDVRPLLDAKLQAAPANENERRQLAESTSTVADYVENQFLPYARRELKASTSHGYAAIWKLYLQPRFENIVLCDVRCVDITNVLSNIHQHHGLGRKSLRHCKALLSVIFTHAKRSGVLDGANPAKDAGIPRAAEASKPTHAYTADEVFAMLNALEGVAKTAVALMYFCGLRPGEARAVKWEDYDGKTLRVRASMWRTILSEPKTAESVAPVPVAETLRDILGESRGKSGYILAGPSKKPVDLHNLASRKVVPALALCAQCNQKEKEHAELDHEFKPLPTWVGWYGLRRGLATLATSIDSQLAAKSLLRHSNVQTTQQFYIKSVPADALRAVEKMDALFQKSANSAPN